MPLNFEEIAKKINEKKADFIEFDKNKKEELNQLKIAGKDAFTKDYDEIMTILDSDNTCGAKPSEEYRGKKLIYEFAQRFSSLDEMIKWAAIYLENKNVVGSDGSQIYPSSDFSVPVSIIQIAWYRNQHTKEPQLPFEKLTTIEVLTPKDLEMEDEHRGRMMISQEPVNAHRFTLEMKVLTDQMEIAKKAPNPIDSYFISDGSLILSFLDKMSDISKEMHLNALKKCLDTSKTTEYPLIGYVDSSDAKDVANMIRTIGGKTLKKVQYISDAAILEYIIQKELGYTMQLGDRTCTFICYRDDPIYSLYINPKMKKDKDYIGYPIAFFYIKLNSEQLVRVEFPGWIANNPTKISELGNIIVADAIIGSGYPYTTDQAHQTAVITQPEYEKFYRLFQTIAKEQWKIPFSLKNKARSKRRHKF
jgi:hypothetical protein